MHQNTLNTIQFLRALSWMEVRYPVQKIFLSRVESKKVWKLRIMLGILLPYFMPSWKKCKQTSPEMSYNKFHERRNLYALSSWFIQTRTIFISSFYSAHQYLYTSYNGYRHSGLSVICSINGYRHSGLSVICSIKQNNTIVVIRGNRKQIRWHTTSGPRTS